MNIEGLAAKRIALQTALGTRAGRLLEAQYDALVAAQYDTPEALLDASEGNLKEVLKPALGAVDAVLSWQRETKQDAALKAAGTGAGPSGIDEKLDVILAQQKEVVAQQKHVMEALNFVMIDLEEALRPPSDSAKVSKGDAADFRRRLMEVYNNLPDNHEEVKCTVLDKRLPKRFIVAGHLLPRRAQKYARKLLRSDINDVRNGLLWASPIEHAFESQWLIFSNDSSPIPITSSTSSPPSQPPAPVASTATAVQLAPAASSPLGSAAAGRCSYKLHILDKAKLDLKVADTGEHKDDRDFRQLLGEIRWRDIHNKIITFSGNIVPFQRALMIHARYALKHRLPADFPEDLDLEELDLDITSEMDNKGLVRQWLDGLPSLGSVAEEPQLSHGGRMKGKRKGGKRKGKR